MGFVKSVKSVDNYTYKETASQSLDSGAYFRKVIENADVVPFQLIFGLHIGEGFYINVGSGISQLLGIKPEYLTERLYNSMIKEIVPLSEDIPSDFVKSREKFINGGIKNFKAEVLINTIGGERKWIKESSMPMIDKETGKVVGSFGILFDISKSKSAIDNNSAIQAETEDNYLLKEAFLHNILHEIRTPLNAIVGFSSLLNEPQYYGREQLHEYVDIITQSTDHLLEIINDIVDISRIEANNVIISKNELNLNSLLNRIHDKFNSKSKEKNILLNLVLPFEKSEFIIVTDEFKLFYVLSNIVSNAIKFTKEGKIEFGYQLKGDTIEFYVSDTGIGIPTMHQPKIFDKFYQVDSSCTRCYEGTGLGLTISKAYIEMLGGKIWLTSKPDKGSVFYFTIPLQGY